MWIQYNDKNDYEKFSKYNVASERDAVDNQYENWMTKFDREPKRYQHGQEQRKTCKLYQ